MLSCWTQMGITPSLGEWSGRLITGVAGSTTSTTAGSLAGYSRPGWYNASVPAGSIDTDLFVDRRNPATPKTIRLMGIVQQSTSFIVIGWKTEPTIPPSTTMPSMHGSLWVNGVEYKLSTGTRPGVQAGYDGLYWSKGASSIPTGQPFSFEFK